MTEAPETLKMFFKQRFRWSFGVMQTFWKNRDALFNWKYRWLGWVALPNILIFQYIIPFVIPIACNMPRRNSAPDSCPRTGPRPRRFTVSAPAGSTAASARPQAGRGPSPASAIQARSERS